MSNEEILITGAEIGRGGGGLNQWPCDKCGLPWWERNRGKGGD